MVTLFQTPNYPLIIAYEFAIVAVGCLVAIPLVKRHLAKRLLVTHALVIAGGCQLLAALTSAVSRILRITGAWVMPDGRTLELLAVTVTLLAAGEIFWLAFTLEVFYGGMFAGKNRVVLLTYAGFVVAFGIYAISTGLYVVDVTAWIWGFLVTLTAPVFLLLFISARNVARKLKDPVGKWGTRLISIGPMLLLTTFVFFLIDRILGGPSRPFTSWRGFSLSAPFSRFTRGTCNRRG